MTVTPITDTSQPATAKRRGSANPLLRVLQDAWKTGRFRIGTVIFVAIVLFALIGPFISPQNPVNFVGMPFTGATGQNWLGTDALGRDVLSRLLHGGNTIVWMSLGATALGVGAGAIIGLVAGYVDGPLGEVLMRICDVVLAFPGKILMLLLVSAFGTSPMILVLCVALIFCPQVARVIRGATIEIARKEFVEWAELVGFSRARILVQQILPSVSTPLMAEFGTRITWAIGLISSMSFLGFGLQPPSSDWGLMINENRNGIILQPLSVFVPLVLIALFTIGANLMADGIARAVAGIDRKGGAE